MHDAAFDSSFWINADRCGLLPYTLERFRLWAAPQVAAEMHVRFPSGREFQRKMQVGEILERAPVALHIHEFGVGERAAISLAMENPGWLLLLDDYRPHLAAGRLGLTVISTPTFTLTLYTEGVISAEETLMILGRLAEIRTVSPHLFAASLAQFRPLRESTGGE